MFGEKQIQWQIFCPLMLNECIRGMLVFLSIAKEPIDKDQDAETFC